MDKKTLAEAIEMMGSALIEQGDYVLDEDINGWMPDGERPDGTHKYCGCFAGFWGWSVPGSNYTESTGHWVMATHLAKFLGYHSAGRLEIWAEANPKIWGNVHGADIFRTAEAFGVSSPADARDVIEHLVGVYERLEASG